MLICEGIFFLIGLFLLVTGKMRFTNGKRVEGGWARLMGFVLLLPIILAFGIGFFVGIANGGYVSQDTLWNLNMFEIVLIGIAGIIFVGLGISAPNTPSIASIGDVMTAEEAAKILRLSEGQVKYLIETGQIEAGQIGDHYRISRQAIESFLRGKNRNT